MEAGGSVRVLLMEDDAGLARLCQKRLARSGCKVDHALDGEQGLALHQAGDYDIVLLDHSMPVYDGLEVIRRIASSARPTPAVMVTGAGSEQIAVEALRLGARDYVIKDVEGGYLDLLPTVIERVLRQEKADREMQLAAKVFESVSEGILITDPQGRIISTNHAFTAITGYSSEEVAGLSAGYLASDRSDPRSRQAMRRALHETGRWEGEMWDRRKDGSALPVWLRVSSVRDQSGAITNFVGVIADITFRKQAEERLQHLATHDPLTGLANRAFFQDTLAREILLARRDSRMLAVMLLDVDHFKIVNDTFGHAAGDVALKGFADRLARALRESDLVARLGGDEFVVLLTDIDSAYSASVMGRVLSALSHPISVGLADLVVTCSAGIALYPNDATDAEELLRKADAAMYRAKKRRGCCVFASDHAPADGKPVLSAKAGS